MRTRVWLGVVLLLALALGAWACRKSITYPIYRRPVISSVVAFPTVLGPGDSTMITIFATDPDGDSLVYDWLAYNGLSVKDDPLDDGELYNTQSPSRVFYRTVPSPASYDTAFVYCYVRDGKGGMDGRHVLIFYKD